MLINNLGITKINKTKDFYNYNEYELRKSVVQHNLNRLTGLQLIKNYEDYSDSELVDLYVSESDKLAFTEIFNRYNHKVKGLALKILSDVDEAEDIVQEVFIILLKSMTGFRRESKFSTWIYSIALNTIKSRIRHMERERKYITTVDEVYINSTKDKEYIVGNDIINSQLNNPEYINISKEITEKLHHAIKLLPEKYKDPILLKAKNGFSNHQVATHLGLSLPAVKSRVHRARLHLEKSLRQKL